MALASRVIAGKSKRDDFKIELNKVALLIIDIQENLNLANKVDHDQQLPLQNIQELLDITRESRSTLLQSNDKSDQNNNGSEVIFTFLESLTDNSRDVSLDYKLSGYLAKLPSPSNPAIFLDTIHPIKGQDILIPKTSCSVFNSTNINYVLRNLGLEQLILCGQLTNECIESTARDAADLGYFVTVAEDACLAMSVESHQKGLFGMRGFARIITTNQIVQEFRNSSISIIPKKINIVETADNAAANKSSSSSIEVSPLKSILVPYEPPNMELGAVKALLTALRYSKVRHIRFGFVDIDNIIRCKAIPLHRLSPDNLCSLVNIAKIVSAGLPIYGDSYVPGSGLSASGNLALHPDLSSLRILPYVQSSAMIMCYQYEKNKILSNLCTRALLHQVIQTAKTKYGLQFCIGAEIEFCLYKKQDTATIEPVDLSSFAYTKTLNEQQHFICDLEDMLILQGIEIELIHAESAGGQVEIVLKYQDDALAHADNVILAKETITACATKYDMKAIFLPKISSTQAGNGLHLHFSFYDNDNNTSSSNRGVNAFPDFSQKESISSKGKSFMEGILKRLPSLLSFTLPTQNSFRRVGPGFWTGYMASWATEDKEQALRVCLNEDSYATNVEYKLHDSTANIYLSLATILLSGLDGISHNLSLRDEMSLDDGNNDGDNYIPSTLNESLNILEKDNFFMDNVGKELITAYIAVKRSELDFFKDKTIDDELEFIFHRS